MAEMRRIGRVLLYNPPATPALFPNILRGIRVMSRFVQAAVLGLATMVPGAISAQSSSILPAEFPPATFEGNQYVDSSGCAFIRAGISGSVTWVPRMSQDRSQLCGFEPTFAGQAIAAAPIPDDVAIIVPDPVAAAAETAAAAPAQPAAAPAPAPSLASIFQPSAPTQTIASIQTPPNLGDQASAPPRIDAPTTAPIPAQAPTPAAAAEPAPITLAEACDGRTGLQPRFINARTGAPIDCGPAAAPEIIPASAPAPAPAAAPEPANAGVLRLTLSEICSRAAQDGTRFVDANTGQPIACPTAPTVFAGGPSVPSGPASPSAPAVPGLVAIPTAAPTAIATAAPVATGCANPRIAATPGTVSRCGPQVESPSGITSPLLATPGHSVARAPAGLAIRAPVPASNPVGVVPTPTAPAPGYVRAFDDGRVNLQRGLPAAAVVPQVVAQPEARISSRNVPQPTTNAHRYVQVGTYGNPANADNAVARLQALGLPVGRMRVTRNGQVYQAIAAGPFGSASALNAALQAARSAGYSDAFTRR